MNVPWIGVSGDGNRYVNRLRSGNTLALRFHPGALGRFQRHLVKVTPAFFGAVVLAGRATGGDCLLLPVALLPFSRFFGLLNGLTFFNVMTHALNVSFGLQS